MKNLQLIIKKNLDLLKEQKSENYMFFQNLKQIKRQCDLLLELDPNVVEDLLQNGHDWADDHVTEAKVTLDQVFDFLMNETNEQLDEEVQIDESKNKPTNPKLWAASLAWAKSKYKVCPSAYCNGAAAKRYKSKGGKWKKIS